jgi:ribosomal RNA assembly protein
MQYLKIPKDRVAVLIGREGSVKKEIEERTKTRIVIDEGDISIEGNPVGILTARDVILAIGRGFSPEIAFRLFNEENILEIIPLKDYIRSERELARKKGRIIGRKGKTRSVIEGVTNTNVSVYGKSVGIIGKYDQVETAKEAILRLLRGARHSSVYRFLEKSRGQESEFPDYEDLLKE